MRTQQLLKNTVEEEVARKAYGNVIPVSIKDYLFFKGMFSCFLFDIDYPSIRNDGKFSNLFS